MKLNTAILVSFKKERVKQFLKIKDLSYIETERRLEQVLGRRVNGTLDKWFGKEDSSPQNMEIIHGLVKVLEIPIEFFYYRISVTMENWIYIIHCYETNKTITIRNK